VTAERPVLTHEQALDLAPLYVLGVLEPAEAAAVREHLATCAEDHGEFAELGSVAPALLEDVELVEPPEELRSRILAAAAADLEARGGAPATVAAPAVAAERAVAVDPAAAAQPGPAAPIIFPDAAERDARRQAAEAPVRKSGLARLNDWAFRIAAILAIVVLGAWNVLLQRDLAAEQDYRTAVTQVIEVAGQPGSSLAIISGQGGEPARGLAAVDGQGTVVFAMRDLAPTDRSEVYTAWSIVGDNAPVNIGEFTVGPAGTGSLTTAAAVAAPGATLALTREPDRGATTPTMPIVAAGVVTPAG
jgi:anti-sigma factor RsiW